MQLSRPVLAISCGLVFVLVVAACSAGTHSTATSDRSTTLAPLPTVPAGNGPTAPIKAAVKPAGTTTDIGLTTPDGRIRSYHLYVPASAGMTPVKGGMATTTSGAAAKPLPLLIAMHGGLGSGTQFEKQSGFDGVAEANDFIVAYPDGWGNGPRGGIARTWNGGGCCGPAMKQNVDDVTFIKMVIEQVQSHFPIDPSRIYAAGHSNGGIMAYRLACELSGTIAAIGVQSTSMEVAPCHPSEPVSVLHIHGTADQNIPINGGVGDEGVTKLNFNPPINGVRTMAANDGCSAAPTTSADPSNADITIERWTSCKPGISVEFVKVAGAAHAWMGHPASTRKANPYQKLDSTATIWAFLAAHPKP